MKTANFVEQRNLFDQKDQETQKRESEEKEEYKERQTAAHSEMREAINDGIASYGDLEDICLGHGVDCDEIEMILLGY